MKDESKFDAGGCFALVVSVPLTWARWAIEAWCAAVLWGWFAVPLGAPVVGVLPAFGLMAIVGMATHGEIADGDVQTTKTKELAKTLGVSDGWATLLVVALRMAVAPLTLGVCWAARFFFG